MRSTSLRQFGSLLAALACALLINRASAAASPGNYTFKVLAGAAGTRGYVDGIGSAARFDNPGGMAVDAAGNVYLSERDLHVIRKISPEGMVSTIAGVAGQSGAQDGIGATARFKNPSGLALNAAGSLYVADTGNHTIRKIDPSGNVTTYAGKPGEWGRIDGPREIARLGAPAGLAIDTAGNLFLHDDTASIFDSRWLRKIAPDGATSSLTIAENIYIAARQICVDPSGNLYVTLRQAGPAWDWTNVFKLTPTAEAGRYDMTNFDPPGTEPWIRGIGTDLTGRLFVRDLRGQTHVYTPDGGWQIRDHAGITWVDSDPETYDVMAASPSGQLYLFRYDSSAAGVLRGAVEIEVFDPDPATLAILRHPQDQSIAAGSTVAFNVAASSASAPAYQWTKDGIPVAGATDATLILRPTIAASAGAYRCVVTNRAGSLTSDAATLSIASPNEGGRFGGLSVRADLFAASKLVTGLVVSGGNKPVLLRAIGPGLRPFLPSTALKDDPRLELYDAAGALVQANDNWGGDAAMARAFASAGTFPLASDSKDAALLRSIDGACTAHVFGDSYGTVLFEAYDTDGGEPAARLVNLSARASIYDRDGAVIAGIVITGETSQTVLVRGIGPALAAFGVSDALANPKLEVFNASGVRLAENDDWPSNLAAIAADIQAFALPAGSRDAALVLSRPPGAYTAVLSGVSGSTGEGLLEVYEVP